MSKVRSWTTESECLVLDNLERNPEWGDFKPEIKDRITALEGWIKTSAIRVWPKSIHFSLEKCREHAEGCLARLRTRSF